MELISKILTDKWKEIIESINVDGYSRKVESVNLFRMDKYYTGYPEIEFCYKVNFNFPLLSYDGIDRSMSLSQHLENKKNKPDDRIDRWYRELESRFTDIFYDKPTVKPKSGEEWWRATLNKPRKGINSGETKFENDKVDYMTNQGYRFIVQFYPKGFLSELREEKINKILLWDL